MNLEKLLNKGQVNKTPCSVDVFLKRQLTIYYRFSGFNIPAEMFEKFPCLCRHAAKGEVRYVVHANEARAVHTVTTGEITEVVFRVVD